MVEILPFLKNLTTIPGLSGYEAPIRLQLESAWQSLTDEITVSRLGSLHAIKRGSGAEPRKRLLVTAHMDIIGLMVTGIVDGFLRLTEVGGLDHRVLPGQLVTVHGRQDLPGLVVQPPAHLLPPDNQFGPVKLGNLLVDTGLLAAEVSRLVRPGDLISFAQPPVEMQNQTLASRYLDNRASLAALTECLNVLQGRELKWDLWAAATTQEEETFAGAYTSAFLSRPDLAVVIDVTFASSPGSPSHRSFPLGKGPTLGYGANIQPALHKAFKDLADNLEIPYKVEIMPPRSGTEAYAIQVAAEGIPTMALGIPLRYMHTPVEIVSLKDITRTGRLVAEFASSLDEHSLEALSFKD
jgi:putative aminopeptidase FrvX